MALGHGRGMGAPYGAGRWLGGSAGAAKRSPQHFLVNDQLDYIRTVTRSFRAAELTVIPKRTRTAWRRDTPKTAARIAGGIGATDPGEPFSSGRLAEDKSYNYRRVRETLVARSRLFRSVAAKRGATG
jgi:hypothetical protein